MWKGEGGGHVCMFWGVDVEFFFLCLLQASSVKKAFLRHSAGKLCQFFGPQRGVCVTQYVRFCHTLP